MSTSHLQTPIIIRAGVLPSWSFREELAITELTFCFSKDLIGLLRALLWRRKLLIVSFLLRKGFAGFIFEAFYYKLVKKLQKYAKRKRRQFHFAFKLKRKKSFGKGVRYRTRFVFLRQVSRCAQSRIEPFSFSFSDFLRSVSRVPPYNKGANLLCLRRLALKLHRSSLHVKKNIVPVIKKRKFARHFRWQVSSLQPSLLKYATFDFLRHCLFSFWFKNVRARSALALCFRARSTTSPGAKSSNYDKKKTSANTSFIKKQRLFCKKQTVRPYTKGRSKRSLLKQRILRRKNSIRLRTSFLLSIFGRKSVFLRSRLFFRQELYSRLLKNYLCFKRARHSNMLAKGTRSHNKLRTKFRKKKWKVRKKFRQFHKVKLRRYKKLRGFSKRSLLIPRIRRNSFKNRRRRHRRGWQWFSWGGFLPFRKLHRLRWYWLSTQRKSLMFLNNSNIFFRTPRLLVLLYQGIIASSNTLTYRKMRKWYLLRLRWWELLVKYRTGSRRLFRFKITRFRKRKYRKWYRSRRFFPRVLFGKKNNFCRRLSNSFLLLKKTLKENFRLIKMAFPLLNFFIDTPEKVVFKNEISITLFSKNLSKFCKIFLQISRGYYSYRVSKKLRKLFKRYWSRVFLQRKLLLKKLRCKKIAFIFNLRPLLERQLKISFEVFKLKNIFSIPLLTKQVVCFKEAQTVEASLEKSQHQFITRKFLRRILRASVDIRYRRFRYLRLFFDFVPIFYIAVLFKCLVPLAFLFRKFLSLNQRSQFKAWKFLRAVFLVESAYIRFFCDSLKIQAIGRIQGKPKAQQKLFMLGPVLPTQTLIADILYYYTQVVSRYGTIGLRFWLYTGLQQQKKICR